MAWKKQKKRGRAMAGDGIGIGGDGRSRIGGTNHWARNEPRENTVTDLFLKVVTVNLKFIKSEVHRTG